MPTVNRIYFANGSYLDESANPYDKGTDAYYWYRRMRRNAAEGRAPLQMPSFIEGGKIADLDEWGRRQLAEEKALDKSGQVAAGYAEFVDPQSGQKYYRATQAAPRAGNFYEYGKEGGAGNATPGVGVDNSWNLAEGADIRTDQQKFYDRDLSGWQAVADAAGRYSWYATEKNYDPSRPQETRQVNLSALGAAKPQTTTYGWDSLYGKGNPHAPVDTSFRPDEYGRQDYWNYNDAPAQGFFDQAMRQRENRSLSARGGYGGYRY